MAHDGPMVSLTIRSGEQGDERIDLGNRLIGFEYRDSDNKADKCILTLDNSDLKFFDDSRFRKGQLIEVSWGYDGKMHPPRAIIVKRVSGSTTLKIQGYAKSVLMNRIQKLQTFLDKTRSEVVKEIAKGYGFRGSSLHIENTDETFNLIYQHGETDAKFLKRLALREGFVFFIDETGLHWHDRKFNKEPIKRLTYFTDPGKGDILNFNMDSDLYRQPGKVKVKSTNPKTKKEQEAIGSDSDTKRTSLGGELEVAFSEFKAAFSVDEVTGEVTTTVEGRMETEVVHNSSAETEKSAKKEADRRFKRASRQRIKLTLDINGDVDMRAKEIIEITGLGDYLSGKYYLPEVVHTINGNGYVEKLSCLRDNPSKVQGKAAKTKSSVNKKSPKDEDKLEGYVDEQTGENYWTRS